MFEVYIHVPFCMRRCGYCDFNTYTATDLGEGASRSTYAAMAIREMQLVHDWQIAHGIHEPAASTVFFGGGTPTILPAADLVRMLDAVRDIWGIADDAEITTEANPDTVDAAYIQALAEGGFTRISFGMQSAVPKVLATLDRTHTPENVTAGVRAAQAAGLRTSVDLIYGAPGESLDDWRDSVQVAIDLGVNHVSAYALTVEPTTSMGRKIATGTLPKPDDDDEAAKYVIADQMLSAAGLEWYEISNWARPGFESQHNLGYWRNVDWAGIGPGAHSHYASVAVDGEMNNKETAENAVDEVGKADAAADASVAGDRGVADLRAWDIAHPRAWGSAINAGQVPWAGSEQISADEHMEELLMLGVRLREGLDMSSVNQALGEERLTAASLKPLVTEGLVTIEQGRVIPTLEGRLLNDTLIARLFALCDL